MSQRITKAQAGVLSVLEKGLSVEAEPYTDDLSGYWRAKCEYLPTIHMPTLDILDRNGFIGYTEKYGERQYFITSDGRNALFQAEREPQKP